MLLVLCTAAGAVGTGRRAAPLTLEGSVGISLVERGTIGRGSWEKKSTGKERGWWERAGIALLHLN